MTRSMVRRALLVAALIAPASSFAILASRPANASSTTDVMVEARDGAELATTVYVPDGEGPWPCVVSRTPYGKKGLRGVGESFVRRGFAFVAQDCRGRHDSPGRWLPFKTDPEDGYDTVEWAAKQPWSNGRIGLYGGSALGMTAQLAATQAPPSLVCAYVVVAPASARRHTVYAGGVYRKELNDGWLASQGALYAIRDNVAHPPGDSYWNWREIPDFHARMNIPVCQVGGWFDIFSEGAIENFSGLQRLGAGRAAGNQRLVMGPWAHGPLNGRLKFPNDDRVGDFLAGKEVYRWFSHWLKGEDTGLAAEDSVEYYMLGDPDRPAPGSCEWRTSPSWPPPSRPTSFFLWPKGRLARDVPPEDGGSIVYRYDPNHPVPTAGGGNLILGRKGPVDQREIKDREDYFRFHSEPLATPIEIAGAVYVDLFVESDAPDTDFVAKLVDVYPDGYEALILDGIIRARYRAGLETETPLRPGEVTAVRIHLWSTAISFAAGHRIGVHISSSNDPRFDPNPNTGAPLRRGDQKRVATNRVHHSAARPSRILLPVLASTASREKKPPPSDAGETAAASTAEDGDAESPSPTAADSE